MKTHALIALGFLIFSCSKRPIEGPPPAGLAKQMLADSSYTWMAFQTPHFRFYYEPNSYAAAHIEALSEAAAEARSHALKLLGENNYAPVIDLFYLDSREKMVPALGTQPLGWSERQSNTVLLVCNEKQRPLHRHEIMHVLSMNLWPLPPLLEAWLLEGLAVYADAPCSGFSLHEIAAQLQREDKLLPLYNLVYAFYQPQDLRAYMQGGSVVQFLFENWGHEKFRQLWARGVGGLPEITGKSYREFEQEWRMFLLKQENARIRLDWKELITKGCD